MLSGGGDLQLMVREKKNITDGNQCQERNVTGTYRDRQERHGAPEERTESQSICSETRKGAERIQWIKHLPHKDLDQSSHPNIHVNAGDSV